MVVMFAEAFTCRAWGNDVVSSAVRGTVGHAQAGRRTKHERKDLPWTIFEHDACKATR